MAPESKIQNGTLALQDFRVIANNDQLYAVVDASNAPGILLKVLELGEQHAISLYRGTAEEEYSEVAPYLLKVNVETLNWILANLSKETWGFFAVSDVGLDALRGHFRHFLQVQTPAGEVWYFRFFDPRVLKVFLPSCTENELAVFFGPVRMLALLENDEVNSLVAIRPIINSVTESSRRQLLKRSLYFQFRVEQIEAFQQLIQADFLRRVVNFLREDHVEVTSGMSETVLEQRISFGLSKARSYGLSTEASLAAFVGLMFEISPTFDEQPNIQSILRSNRLAAESRINALIKLTSEDDWKEAALQNNTNAWDRAVQQFRG